MSLFDDILAARGLTGALAADFLSPDYSKKHDPFLLPDMQAAVDISQFAWDKADIKTADAWNRYMADFAQKVRNPLSVKVN